MIKKLKTQIVLHKKQKTALSSLEADFFRALLLWRRFVRAMENFDWCGLFIISSEERNESLFSFRPSDEISNIVSL